MNDYFGISDRIKSLTAPAGLEAVHEDGFSWAKQGTSWETSTRWNAADLNRLLAQWRALFTIDGVDLTDLAADSPFILKEALLRSIVAALPAAVGSQLPALAELLDEDIDLVAALAASAPFRDAVAADPDLAAAVGSLASFIEDVAADPGLVAAVAGAIGSNASALTSGTLPDARLSFSVSAFAKTVLDDPDAATWRATVGAISQADGDARWAKLSGAGFTNAITGTSGSFSGAINAFAGATNGGVDLNGASIEIGTGRAGDGNSFIDLHSSAGTDYDARIIRSSGVNAALTIVQVGTGGINITPGSGGLNRDGNSVRDVANTPNMSDAEATAGTDTTPKVPTAAQLKLAAETWGAKGAAFAVVADQKANGTGGGTSTASSWVTRTLNTEVKDPLNRVTLSSNTFVSTVNAEVQWSAPGYQVNAHMTRLYNVTDGVVVAYGTTGRSPATYGIMTRSFGLADIVAGKTYRIEHWCATTDSSGLGYASSASGATESYAIVAFYGR